MSKFKKVFKGYDMAEVDAYVAQTQKRICELERQSAGKPIVTNKELIVKQTEIQRKQRVLDSTFKVFFSLVKNKLSKDELEEFNLVADMIQKMNVIQCDQTADKILTDAHKKTDSANLTAEAQEDNASKNDVPQVEQNPDLSNQQIKDVEQQTDEQQSSQTASTANDDDGAPLIDLAEINNFDNSLSLEDLCKDIFK